VETNESILENERKTLEIVISEMDKFINDNSYPPGTNIYALYEKQGFGDIYIFHTYIHSLNEQAKKYSSMKDSPYFGKIGIEENNNKETFYISSSPLYEVKCVRVIDWRSPMGALFYEASKAGYHLSTLPNRNSRVAILQKIRFSIQGSTLNDIIVDFFTSNSFQKGLESIVANEGSEHEAFGPSSNTLTEGLSQQSEKITKSENQKPLEADRFLSLDIQSRGDPKFHTIYKTIQTEQYRIMKLPSDKVVIINGVAGSGKTSIGYHRLAYLAYEERLSPLTPTKVLIIGPNRLFLSFIKELLPSLGIIGVRELTFEDWALMTLDLAEISKNGEIKRHIEITDKTTELFMNSKVDRTQKQKLWKRAKIKGGLRFGKALESIISEDFLPCPIQNDLTIADPDNGKKIKLLSIKELSSLWNNQSKNLTYNQKLNSFKTNIESIITQTTTNLSEKILWKTKFKRDVNQLLQDIAFKFSSYPIKVYEKIFEEKLFKIAFNSQEVSEIGDFTFNGKSIDLEDLASILLIKKLLSPEAYKKYDHLLIDEGQDFSPLHYKIFRMLSPSITILGDIAQGVVAHRGLTKWEDIDEIFPNKIIENMLVSYRSTLQITNLANELLPEVSKNKKAINLATPLLREGAYPKLIETTGELSLHHCLLNELNISQKDGNTSVCVITKLEKEAEEVYAYLRERGYDCQLITNRNLSFTLNERFTIIPINLSKGLEFNKVILYDVSKNKYDDSLTYDYRLLYVGITRALNDLVMLSNGSPVKLLAESKNIVFNKTNGNVDFIES